VLDIYFNVIQHYLSKGFSAFISLFVMSLAAILFFLQGSHSPIIMVGRL